MFNVINGYRGDCGLVSESIGTFDTIEQAHTFVEDFIQQTFSVGTEVTKVSEFEFIVQDEELEYEEFINVYKI
jgi:hypothetical protein